ncbi:MAG: HAMP domain-containing histidine kinase [Defluviitaleaceae bacterium]|nr:HAMP domain-containing histidine kinase [Defluviitaleaceae bacterium]
MMKNKTLPRLIVYFSCSFVFFGAIIALLFSVLFSRHNVAVHHNELERRAVSIADTLADYMHSNNNRGMGRHGMGGMSNMGDLNAFLRQIENIAMGDIWIVDNNARQLIFGHDRHQTVINFHNLPYGSEHIISAAFDGKVAYNESFSGFWDEPTITVAAPIILANGEIIGAVLLHSKISGIYSATSGGFTLLLYSMAISAVIALFAAILLSVRLTRIEQKKVNKMRDDFFANVSHELRTPITVMRGSLEALLDGVVTEPDKVAEYHRQMLVEGRHMERLVSDLLDLSRLQNADFAMVSQNIDFVDIMKDVARSISKIAQQKNIDISLDIEDNDFRSVGDYGRLRQMLMVVADNAVKFSPPISGRIEMVLRREGSGIVMRIKDNGKGIADGELEQIFDRFHRQRSEQNKTGTGLGLAIAKQIADRHNIKISAQNQPSGGAEFVFRR